MSLADHLSSLETSFTNTFETDIKKKKSLIYEDGSSLSRAEAYVKCKEGYDSLCIIDKRFQIFENLYLESDIDKPIMLLQEDEIKEIQQGIRNFLFISTDYLEIRCTLVAIEWLIFKYDAHIHQPEDILIACLPLHQKPVFIKFIRLLNLKKKDFSWLKSTSESGHALSQSDLSTLCLKNPDVIAMICGWPAYIINACRNEPNACKKMCLVVIAISENVIDKVKLKGSASIQKHMSPFARFINDGLSSTCSHFISAAVIVLAKMSLSTDLSHDFLNDCLKRMLINNILSDYVCLQAIINIVDAQENYQLSEKLCGLFRTKISRLRNDEKLIIEKLLSDMDICKTEAMDVEQFDIKMEACETMECHEIPQSAKQVKLEKLVENVITECHIDWCGGDVESRINELLCSHVLTWHRDTSSKISGKLAQEVIALIQARPKNVKISYRSGGVASYLCVALMSPDVEVRRSVKKLMTKLISDWPRMTFIADIRKSVLINDHKSLGFGDVGLTLLSEIDAICGERSCLTVQRVALSLLNTQTISLATSLPNVWPLFLAGLQPYCKLHTTESSHSALSSIKQSIGALSTELQNVIIDSITTDLIGDFDMLNKVTSTLANIPLKVDNFRYLLRDVLCATPMKATKNKLKKFDAKTTDPTNDVIKGNGKYKVTVALGALHQTTILSTEDKVQLIHPLCTIIRKILMNTDKDASNIDYINLLSNLMSAMIAILPETIDFPTKDSLTPKISIEDITKCLYIFNDMGLHNLILTVLQKFAKLELGLEQFPLIYFMNWLGKNIVPRDDQHSMKILNSVLELILPICIKIRRKSDDMSNDNVQIIASFVKDSAGLPKHRSLMLYNILVKNLSSDGSDALWIQLIIMILNKTTDDKLKSTLNENLVIPLLKKFSKDQQLKSVKQVIKFLVQILNDPSKKRRYCLDGVTNSPIQKKRKMSSIGLELQKEEKNNNNCEFTSLKDYLMLKDKAIDYALLLKTAMTYFLMQIKETQSDLTDVTSEVLIDLISSLFSSMKIVSNATNVLLNNVTKNEITVMIREMIEAVGMSLPRNNYLDLIISLAKNDYDESVKMKSMELLSNKLSLIAKEKHVGRLDNELLSIAKTILSLCRETVNSDNISSFWEYSVSCATSLVSIGIFDQKEVKELCDEIYVSLLSKIDNDLTNLSADKVVLLNVFMQKYVSGDKINDLTNLFKTILKVIENCLQKKQFTNGMLESSLALIHTILARGNSETIGWTLFEELAIDIFELTSLAFELKNLSNASLIYQKNIRIRLSKMNDTNALITTCKKLIDIGKEKKNLTYISGSISLFGTHMNILNKRGKTWEMSDNETSDLWNVVFRLLSVGEMTDIDDKNVLSVSEEIALKALSQMCYLFDFSQEMLTKMTNWSQQIDQSVTSAIYLKRNSIIYRLLSHVISKSKNPEKTLAFVNESNAVSFASAILQHLAGDRDSKKKRKKKVTESQLSIAFTRDQFRDDCPVESMDLVRSVCSALQSHLVAEYKAGMNLVVSDEITSLIGNVCGTLTSLDEYSPSRDEYMATVDKFVSPLIVQLVVNSFNDESLLTPVCMGLCKYFTELPSHVHLAILRVLAAVKEALGAVFDTTIRDKVSSFLDNCKLHDDETVSDLANDI